METRECEYCKCKTNASLRKCCAKGYLADGGSNLKFGYGDVLLNNLENKDPKNGWIVICSIINKYVVCNNRDTLANVIQNIWDELNKNDTPTHPSKLIQVFELGNQVSVGIKPVVTNIEKL